MVIPLTAQVTQSRLWISIYHPLVLRMILPLLRSIFGVRIYILKIKSLLNVRIEQITAEFEFFPRMHAMLASRPNVNPPAITTGVGPHGRNTVFIQPPEGVSNESSADDDGSVTGDDTTFQQYRTLLDALNNAPKPTVPAARPLSPAHSPPNSPTHSQPANDKENVPPSTPRNAASSLAKTLLDKAKSTIRKAPPKPTLEESLIRISRF
jgi:hypothetical protein